MIGGDKNVLAIVTCKQTEERVCLYYNPISKTLKQNPRKKADKNKYNYNGKVVDHHVKEFHQKDHHHRLDKYTAYKLSVIALKRLKKSAELLKLPYYFPRLLREVNNHTYQIEHVGLQSDQIEVQLDEDMIQTQVTDMRRILEHAGVIHLDLEPHCKNIVYNKYTQRISLIDFDIIALRSTEPLEFADQIWVDAEWYPNIYEDRFLDMRGWDNVQKRMYNAIKGCLSPTCFCRSN